MRGLLTQKRCCCLCLLLCLGGQCPFVDGPGWEGIAPPGPANSGTSQSRLISHDSQSVTQRNCPMRRCLAQTVRFAVYSAQWMQGWSSVVQNIDGCMMSPGQCRDLDGCWAALGCCRAVPSLSALRKKMQVACSTTCTDHALLLEQPSLLKPLAGHLARRIKLIRAPVGCLKHVHLFEKLALLCRQMPPPTASTILTGEGLSCLTALLLCRSCWGVCSLQAVPASGGLPDKQCKRQLDRLPGISEHYSARCCGFKPLQLSRSLTGASQAASSRQPLNCSTSAEPAVQLYHMIGAAICPL